MASRVPAVLLLLALLSPVSLAVADDNEPDQPYDVILLLQHAQKDLSELDPNAGSDWFAVEVLGAFFGPGGIALGSSMRGIDALSKHSENEETADSIEAIVGGLNFQSITARATETLDLEGNWLFYDVIEGDFIGESSFVARDLFWNAPIDYVMYIDAHYRLMPQLDRLHVKYNVRLYSEPLRGSQKAQVKFMKSYEVVSASRGEIMRPFHEGEKEALIASIEQRYVDLMERYPQNEKAYSKQRKQALKLVRGRDVVLPQTAMIEGWPGTTLRDEIYSMTDLAAQLMRFDLNDLTEIEYELGDRVKFEALAADGKNRKLTGYAVHQLGPLTIYRDSGGNLYAVPN